VLYCNCSHVLFGFSSKAEARRPVGGRVVPTRAEALPLIPALPAMKGKQGAKAPRKTGVARAPRSASVRGRRQKFMKAMADQALIDVGVGTFDEFPLVIRQSFKDSRYSTSTGMKEIEW
jgi:hypothetical protein